MSFMNITSVRGGAGSKCRTFKTDIDFVATGASSFHKHIFKILVKMVWLFKVDSYPVAWLYIGLPLYRKPPPHPHPAFFIPNDNQERSERLQRFSTDKRESLLQQISQRRVMVTKVAYNGYTCKISGKNRLYKQTKERNYRVVCFGGRTKRWKAFPLFDHMFAIYICFSCHSNNRRSFHTKRGRDIGSSLLIYNGDPPSFALNGRLFQYSFWWILTISKSVFRRFGGCWLKRPMGRFESLCVTEESSLS